MCEAESMRGSVHVWTGMLFKVVPVTLLKLEATGRGKYNRVLLLFGEFIEQVW